MKHRSIYYPVLKEGVELHLGREETYVIIKDKEISPSKIGAHTQLKKYIQLKKWARHKIATIAARYLLLCDGQTSNLEIAKNLCDGFEYLYGEIWAREIQRQFDEYLGILEYFTSPLNEPRKFRVTGSFDSYYPLHMSYELTEHCNFRCDHCYVSATPEKTGSLPLKEIIELMDKSASQGVRVFEITGGECTTYPHFREVLDHAAKVFDLVAVITNGYAIGINKDLQDVFDKYGNVFVQVSIDGMRDYHDNFRKMPGAFDAAINAVKALKSKGIIIRIATTVSENNVHQLRDLYYVVKALKADAWAVAPVSQFGRGKMISNTESEHIMIHKIDKELAEFAQDPLFDWMRRAKHSASSEKRKNCGAGHQTFSLDYKGNVRSCLYLVDSFKFGNVRDSDYEKMFGQEAVSQFHNAPSPGGDDCVGCKYRVVCSGCFAKAFTISEIEYPECPWRKKWFPELKLNLKSNSASCGSGGCCTNAILNESHSDPKNSSDGLIQIRGISSKS